MAEDVKQPPWLRTEAQEPVESFPTRGERARSSAYRFRFLTVAFGLATVVGIGLGALVVELTRPAAPRPEAWSTWRPDGNESARILQIVDHVPKAYRLSNRKALVLAHPSSPSITVTNQGQQIEVPIAQITLLPALDTVNAATSLQISYCGLGATCEVRLTQAMATYLRRETVEIALYTFEYASSVQSITFLMPPTDPQTVIFLERQDVADELSRPLSKSLSEKPPVIGRLPKRELALVNRLTQPRLYHSTVKAEPGGAAVEVLTPLSAG